MGDSFSCLSACNTIYLAGSLKTYINLTLKAEFLYVLIGRKFGHTRFLPISLVYYRTDLIVRWYCN